MSARGQVDSHQATNSQKDMLVLSSHFLSQPVPDTRKKSFLYDGSHTSQRDLLNKAFKALMCRRSKKRQKGLPVIDRLSTSEHSPPKKTGLQKTPLGACFKCGNSGHRAKNNTSTHLRPGPCPNCVQVRH